MKLTGTRAELAQVIERRNAAAADVEQARAAFVGVAGIETRTFRGDRTGEACEALRDEQRVARRNLEELEERLENMRAANNDRVSIHRYCISEYGDNADAVLGKAKETLAEAERRLAAMEVKMSAADVALADAEKSLSDAEGKVSAAVNAVSQDAIAFLQSDLQKAVCAVLEKTAALKEASSHINFEHREYWQTDHPLRMARTLLMFMNNWITPASHNPTDFAWLNPPYCAGAEPWRAVKEALKLDASAPLPTDPPPRPAKVAA